MFANKAGDPNDPDPLAPPKSDELSDGPLKGDFFLRANMTLDPGLPVGGVCVPEGSSLFAEEVRENLGKALAVGVTGKTFTEECGDLPTERVPGL